MVLVIVRYCSKWLAYLGPFSGPYEKPSQLNKFFSCYHRCKPRAFEEKSYELWFMSSPQRVFHFSPFKAYIHWLDKVEKKKEQFWKDRGIYDLIQLSKVGPKYNTNMLIPTLFFWEDSINTFHLRCGMVTHTLFDVSAITGLNPLGKPSTLPS